MKKKVNPSRRPATQRDVQRAREEGLRESVRIAWAIMFTVLLDKEGYDLDGLQRVWEEVSELSDAIAKGYVSVKDLEKVLYKESNIELINKDTKQSFKEEEI